MTEDNSIEYTNEKTGKKTQVKLLYKDSDNNNKIMVKNDNNFAYWVNIDKPHYLYDKDKLKKILENTPVYAKKKRKIKFKQQSKLIQVLSEINKTLSLINLNILKLSGKKGGDIVDEPNQPTQPKEREINIKKPDNNELKELIKEISDEEVDEEVLENIDTDYEEEEDEYYVSSDEEYLTDINTDYDISD